MRLGKEHGGHIGRYGKCQLGIHEWFLSPNNGRAKRFTLARVPSSLKGRSLKMARSLCDSGSIAHSHAPIIRKSSGKTTSATRATTSLRSRQRPLGLQVLVEPHAVPSTSQQHCWSHPHSSSRRRECTTQKSSHARVNGANSHGGLSLPIREEVPMSLLCTKASAAIRSFELDDHQRKRLLLRERP